MTKQKEQGSNRGGEKIDLFYYLIHGGVKGKKFVVDFYAEKLKGGEF